MSHNPKTFVKPNHQKEEEKTKSKNEKQQGKPENVIDAETENNLLSNDVAINALSLEEQLECFADLLIDELLKQTL